MDGACGQLGLVDRWNDMHTCLPRRCASVTVSMQEMWGQEIRRPAQERGPGQSQMDRTPVTGAPLGRAFLEYGGAMARGGGSGSRASLMP